MTSHGFPVEPEERVPRIRRTCRTVRLIRAQHILRPMFFCFVWVARDALAGEPDSNFHLYAEKMIALQKAQ
jgi:hypothetical protein